jgi:hypothetical protein
MTAMRGRSVQCSSPGNLQWRRKRKKVLNASHLKNSILVTRGINEIGNCGFPIGDGGITSAKRYRSSYVFGESVLTIPAGKGII